METRPKPWIRSVCYWLKCCIGGKVFKNAEYKEELLNAHIIPKYRALLPYTSIAKSNNPVEGEAASAKAGLLVSSGEIPDQSGLPAAGRDDKIVF